MRISPAMDAEERLHQKRLGYIKMLHSHTVQYTARADQTESNEKACVS